MHKARATIYTRNVRERERYTQEPHSIHLRWGGRECPLFIYLFMQGNGNILYISAVEKNNIMEDNRRKKTNEKQTQKYISGQLIKLGSSDMRGKKVQIG